MKNEVKLGEMAETVNRHCMSKIQAKMVI